MNSLFSWILLMNSPFIWIHIFPKIQFVYSMNSLTPSSFHLISEFIYIYVYSICLSPTYLWYKMVFWRKFPNCHISIGTTKKKSKASLKGMSVMYPLLLVFTYWMNSFVNWNHVFCHFISYMYSFITWIPLFWSITWIHLCLSLWIIRCGHHGSKG